MILRRIQLTNFRQYHRETLIFQDGITGVVGRNGAGKSSILEAVLWCLFGNRAARTSKEGIKRQGASPAEPCSVELDFELKGVPYRLTRTLSGRANRAEAALVKLGQLEAVTIRGVDEQIIKLIGLDLKGFLSSFFARQRELNALTDARPAERKDHLASMLGVGRLDAAIELVKEDIKTTRLKMDTLGSVQIDPAKVKESLDLKRAEAETLRQSEAVFRRELTAAESEIRVKTERVEQLRRAGQTVHELERRKSALAARREAAEISVGRLQQELAEIEKLAPELQTLEQTTAGLESLRRQVSRYRQAEGLVRERERFVADRLAVSKSSDELAAKLGRETERMTELEKEVAGKAVVADQLQKAEREREALLGRYRDLNAAVKVAEEKLAGLEEQKRQIGQLGPDAVCQACLRPFGEELPDIEKHFDEEIDRLRRQMEPLRQDLERGKQEGTTLAGRIDAFQKEKERLGRLETDWAAVRAAVVAVKAQLMEGTRRLAGIDKRLAEIGEVVFDPAVLAKDEAALSEMERQREKYIRLSDRAARRPQLEAELTQAGETLANIQKEAAEVSAELAGLAFDETAYQTAQTGLTRCRDRAGSIRLEIERLAGGIRLLESETGNLARQLEAYEQSQVEIGRLRESLTCLERLSMLFAEFRVFLIGRIRPTLSRQTSLLFHEMTAGRYQEVELDEDYSLCLYDRGERFPAARFSGGEIDLLNLCFRLAISVEMASTAGIDQSFIILDEIFGSQDRERQQLIVEGLGRLKSRFRQIIIISHIDEVKEMSEHIISVEVDDSGISRAAMSESA